jgi:N-acetylneuraminic acid mutarotase
LRFAKQWSAKPSDPDQDRTEITMLHHIGRILVLFLVWSGLALVATPGDAAAQTGSWESRASQPPGIGSVVGAVVGDKFYTVGKSSLNATTHFQIYDASTDTWTEIRPPFYGWGPGGAAAIDGKVYFVGGCEVNGDCRIAVSGRLEVYDPANNSWVRLPDMPTRRATPAVVAAGGKLYVIGGVSFCPPCSPQFASVDVYDPATASWSVAAPMSISRETARAAEINGKIYVIGGYNRPADLWVDVVEMYDPATNRWETKAPMPTKRQQVGIAAINGRLHVFGGDGPTCPASNGTPTCAAHEVYDPTANYWDTDTPMRTPRSAMGVGIIAGKIHAVGGTYCASATDCQASQVHEAFVTSPAQLITSVNSILADIITANPGTKLADKVEDARAKLGVALQELTKLPPDKIAALGAIEGTVGDLEAAIKDGLLAAGPGAGLIVQLAGAVRELAREAIAAAIAAGRDPQKIAEAQAYLAMGSARLAEGRFKDAIASYKDALSKGQSA